MEQDDGHPVARFTFIAGNPADSRIRPTHQVAPHVLRQLRTAKESVSRSATGKEQGASA